MTQDSPVPLPTTRIVRGPRRAVVAFAALAATAILFAAAAPVAAAASARCPSSPEKTLVTWSTATDADGEALEVRATTRRSGLSGVYSPDARLQSGLAAGATGTDLVVVVKRDRKGRGAPAVCAGTERVAVLPSISRDELIGSASVNGRRVAWRTWDANGAGAMRVAAIRAGRARSVHRASVPFVGATEASSPAIHLLPSGTVAWKVAARAWVWPIGRKPVKVAAVPRRADGITAPSVRILDDRHVLVDDTARAYRKPAPGSCSRMIGGGPTVDVAGWRITEFNNGKFDDAQEFSSSTSSVVCDPTTGSYLASVRSGASSGTYLGDPGGQDSVDFHRAGDWLLAVHTSGGELGSGASTTEGRNLKTNRHFSAPGVLTLAGPTTTEATGAIAGPGYLAWCERSDAGAGSSAIWLADRSGTRRLATVVGGAPCRLTVQDGKLGWGTDDERQAAPITPGQDPTVG